MADGLTLRHPQTGAMIFSATTVNSHSRGLVITSGAAGSANVANLLRGTPFIIQALPTDATPDYNLPDFTISGSTLSWNAAARHMRVLVGSFAGAAPATAPATINGLVVRNPVTGAVQVSPLDMALQLASYGAVVLERDLSPSPLPMVRGSITVSGVHPIVAFRVQDGKRTGVHRVVANGGGSFTFHFQAQSASAVGLIYWVFDTASSALKLDTDCALVVRDDLGVRTFDSRAYTLKVVALREVAVAGSTQSTSQPSGSTFAVIQSSIGWHSRMSDLGGYGSGIYPPPNVEIGEPQDPRPVGTKWAYMQLLSHMTTAQFSGATITTGMTVFEQWQDWYDASVLPSSNLFGRARHTIIDVTGLPSAVMPNPSAPAVTVSASLREVVTSATGNQTTTAPAVTLSISGGTAPYTISWRKVSGSASVVANGATNATSFSTRVVNQVPDTAHQAVWVADVTDAASQVTTSDPVTFRHQLNLIDVVPDPITIGNLTLNTTEPSGNTNARFFQITGIGAAITIKFDRTNQSDTGGMFTRRLMVFHSTTGSGGPWTYYPVSVTGKAEIVTQNGDWFYVQAFCETTSGIGTTSFTGRVTNVTTGTLLATFGVTATVDSDNNHNVVDQTPDAMGWPNQIWSTTGVATSGAYVAAGPTVSGVNTTTRLRFQLSGVSNNLTSSGWRITSIVGGVHTNLTSTLSLANGASVEIDVTNGTNLTFKQDGSTNNGVRSASGTVTVSNVSTGGTGLGSFSFGLTLDSGNTTDVTANPISAMTALSPVSNDQRAFLTGNFRQITGISQAVTLRVTVTGATGNLSSWLVRTYRNATGATSSGGPWATIGDITANNGSVEFTITNNQWIYFLVEGWTTSGRRAGGWNVTVTNVSDGSVLGSFRSDIVVDNDDNFNLLTVSVDNTYVTGHATGSAGDWLTAEAVGQVAATITGGVGTVSMAWEKLSGLASGWGVAGTTAPSFTYYGQANFNVTATYRLRVTDSVRTVYSPVVTVNLTGGLLV